jgi:hypothetical protein
LSFSSHSEAPTSAQSTDLDVQVQEQVQVQAGARQTSCVHRLSKMSEAVDSSAPQKAEDGPPPNYVLRATLTGHLMPVAAVKFSPCGVWLASCSTLAPAEARKSSALADRKLSFAQAQTSRFVCGRWRMARSSVCSRATRPVSGGGGGHCLCSGGGC